MKKSFLLVIIIALTVFAGCGQTAVKNPVESIISEELESNDTTSPTPMTQEEPTTENKDSQDLNEISPFNSNQVSFNIPNDVLEIIKKQPRQSNITDFLVSVPNGVFLQNSYSFEDTVWRNNSFGVIMNSGGELAVDSLSNRIAANQNSSKIFTSLEEALTKRNTALQIFGDFVFVELFDKDMGKQYIGVNYKTGDITSPIDIDGLGIDTAIIFGQNYFYYEVNDVLHRVSYITHVDEELFDIDSNIYGNYYSGRIRSEMYRNSFSLSGNKLIIACHTPSWTKSITQDGEDITWSDNELNEDQSMLKKLKSLGIEFDVNALCDSVNADEQVKKHGAIDLNLDIKKTDCKYSVNSKTVLSIDLTTDKCEVLLNQVGNFYKAYSIAGKLYVEAEPVNTIFAVYGTTIQETITKPYDIQIYEAYTNSNATKTLLGSNVTSILHSEYIPLALPEKQGYIAYVANLPTGKVQVISYDGNTAALTNDTLINCQLVRTQALMGIYINVDTFSCGLYRYEWNKATGAYEWVEQK